MRNISIRRMLLGALLVPILAVTFTSGLAVLDANRESTEAAQETELALAAGGPTTLITALMDERNITALELIGMNEAVTLRVADSATARENTDTRLREFRATIEGSKSSVQAIYGDVAASLESDLAKIRGEVDDYEGVRDLTNTFADDIYVGFTDLVAVLHEANDAGIAEIDDAELRNRARSIASQSRSSDRQSQIARYAALSVILGVTPDDMLEANQVYAGLLAAQTEAIEMLDDDPVAQEVVAQYYGRPNQDEMKSLVEDFLKTQQSNPTEVIAAAGDDTSPNAADAWNATRASIVRRAAEMKSDVDESRRATIFVFWFSVAVTISVALAAARALARPLTRLAAQAHEMAATRLPEAVSGVLNTPAGEDIEMPEVDPITGSSVAEVAEVAQALNSVQERTLALAVEQAGLRRNIADSLLNMGRRVQTLVTHQLTLITEMEESEEDPDALKDLYRLDHLATRVRRNAESLIVLAAPPRDRIAAYGKPVSLLEVTRSAISEVYGYERVDIAMGDTDAVADSVAGHLAHIIAELADNGLYFSPPDTRLVVSGEVSANGYLIEVVDQGVGMSVNALAEANRRLASEESFTVAPSKYLGHYVAGSLAHRIGVDVSLAPNAEGGVTAQILLPTSMLKDGLDSSTDAPTEAPKLVFGRQAAPEAPTMEPAAPERASASTAVEPKRHDFSDFGAFAEPTDGPLAGDPFEVSDAVPFMRPLASVSDLAPDGAPAPTAVLVEEAPELTEPETEERVIKVDGQPPSLESVLAAAEGHPPSLASLLAANRSIISAVAPEEPESPASAVMDFEHRRAIVDAAKRPRQ